MPNISSRDKGNRLERKVAERLGEALGIPLRRTPLSGGWSDSPDVAGDIVCTDPDVEFMWVVECKNREGWRLESLFTDSHKWFDDWWSQVERQGTTSRVPLLIFTRNYVPILAAVPFWYWYWNTDVMLYIMLRTERVVIISFDTLLEHLEEERVGD